jgi:allantoinase
MEQHSDQTPTGWLSPWISESRLTPDLLAETGYRYTLNWCHDDQPVRMHTRGGERFWSLPYPQELNDIPMIVARQMDGKDFAQMIIDNFDEMLQQARQQPLVMGVALHPYIVGQPYRLRHLRRALAAPGPRPGPGSDLVHHAGGHLPARGRPAPHPLNQALTTGPSILPDTPP